MQLSSIHVYPVKSAAPMTSDVARVESRGLEYDRRWLVVDTNGRFLTGREFARMTLIRAQPIDGGLQLDAPGMPTLRVGTAESNATVPVTIWRSQVGARPMDARASTWLGEFLGRPARLVHMDASVRRSIDPEYAQPGDEVSFADGFPLLLISRAALDGLNARLDRPVSMLRFRPNLVVDGALAHAEDSWKRIRIGEVEFDVAKACTRCVFTTVDPDVGERDPEGEPLRTLIGYRRTPDGVTFGQNLIPRSTGTVRIGDRVEVVDAGIAGS
jgi:uncharacterized protein YcbX